MRDDARKKSLERLSSPEQLDRLLVIIRPPGWIALLTLFLIIIGIIFWSFFGKLPMTAEGSGIFFDPRSIELIQSQSEGVVEEVFVTIGEYVKAKAPLVKIKAIGSDESRIIYAPANGRVLMVNVLRGEGLAFGKNLIWFQMTQNEERDRVYSFFSIEKGDQIKPGMRAHIMFEAVRSEIYGKMEGVVLEILPYAASSQGAIVKSIPSEKLREYLTKGEAPVVVVIEPLLDKATQSGYQWTTGRGPPYPILPGSIAQIEVFLEEKRPITYIIPFGAK